MACRQPSIDAAATSEPAEPYRHPTPVSSPRYAWYVVLLLCVVNVFSYMDRMALAVLAPYVKADLNLSDAQLGLLTGLAFSLFYAVCGIPIARWADRGVRRNIISLALAVWSTTTALSGAAQSFWHLFAARVGIGAGEAGCLPPAQSLICDYVPIERRPGMFAIHNFGNYAGMMVGLVLAGMLGEILGWRWTFVALGLPGIALALIVRFTLREPVRGSMDAVPDVTSRLKFVEAVAVLWRCRTYRLLAAFYALNGFVQYGLIQWWPSFYTRSFELGTSSVGWYLGLAIGMGSATGSLLGGFVANKAARRDLRWPLFIGGAATMFAIPTALTSLFMPSLQISIALVACTAVFWSVSNGAVIATVSSVVSASIRAMAGSVAVFCASVLGFGLGPLCVGLFSDLLAASFGPQSLRYALLVPIAMIPMIVLVLFGAGRALPGDLQRVDAK